MIEPVSATTAAIGASKALGTASGAALGSVASSGVGSAIGSIIGSKVVEIAGHSASEMIKKKLLDEIVNKSRKELIKEKLRDTAIKAGSELKKEAAKSAFDFVKLHMMGDTSSNDVASRMVLRGLDRAIKGIPVEKGIKKLFEACAFKTKEVSQLLAENGIRATVFNGPKSLEMAFKANPIHEKQAFIVKGIRKHGAFMQSVHEYAEKNKLIAISGREFCVFGARNVGDYGLKKPILTPADSVPEHILPSRLIRTTDLISKGMPVDFVHEVSFREAKIAPNTGIAVAREKFQPPSEAMRNSLKARYGISDVSSARNWINGAELTPDYNGVITPKEIKERFSTINEIGLSKYLLAKQETSNHLNSLIASRSEALLKARGMGPGRVDAALTQIKRNTTGEFARQLVRDTLDPFFNKIELEVPIKVGDTFTKADLLCTNAKYPILSRGVYVPKGGTLAVEVKAGRATYLANQKEHLEFQSASKSSADASLTVCSKDIVDLTSSVEESIRGALRESAPVYKYLPRKEIMDNCILKHVQLTAETLSEMK